MCTFLLTILNPRNKIMKEKNLTGKNKHIVEVADNHLLSYYES